MQIKARACRRHSAEADFFVAVNNVEHCAAVGQKPLLKALVKGVTVRVLGVVVNPNAVNKIQRIVVIFIIFVKCIVEYVLLNRVDTDSIGAHILNVLKPALIGFLVNFCLINGSWQWVELVLVTGSTYGLGKGIMRMYVFDCHNRKSRDLGIKNTVMYSGLERNEMTGLLKKRSFISEAERLLQTQDDKNWCLVSIDIENFKLFNEWYGHNEGDLLMVQIGAALLQAGERTGGTAGYFGQDDFCLLAPFDMELIGTLYDDIASLVSSRGGNVGFLPAFGVCKVEKGYPTLDLLDRSFLAAQVAKSGYRNRVRIFEKSMYLRTDEEYHVITKFFQALSQHEVVFYLQPQCRASSGKIVGAEALARWIKPDGTVIPPDEFIPILEKRGLISDLDMYIWEEVCRWQRGWIDSGHTPLPVSINVSVADILYTDLPKYFENLTDRYSLERKLIKIEITESSYISNTTLVRDTVHSLREKGFTVLMDDFGSGYSTLNMLKNLNIDIIKLDAQFLRMDESNEEKSIRILESVTNMTKTIGVPIIAEGVETEKQKDFLLDLGCRYIQGYYFYKPMPAADYERLITNPELIDTSGIRFKSNQQFRLRELLDNNIYSDTKNRKLRIVLRGFENQQRQGRASVAECSRQLYTGRYREYELYNHLKVPKIGEIILEYGYSVLMGIFSAMILLYAGFAAIFKDYRILPLRVRVSVAKPKNEKKYMTQFAKTLALVALSPALSALAGLWNMAAALIVLIVSAVFFIWLGSRIMKNVE